MRTVGLICGLVILALPAAAQQPDPVEANLAAQWQAAQTGQQNVADALGKIIEAWRRDRAALAAEREWWAGYLKGLEAPK